MIAPTAARLLSASAPPSRRLLPAPAASGGARRSLPVAGPAAASVARPPVGRSPPPALLRTHHRAPGSRPPERVGSGAAHRRRWAAAPGPTGRLAPPGGPGGASVGGPRSSAVARGFSSGGGRGDAIEGEVVGPSESASAPEAEIIRARLVGMTESDARYRELVDARAEAAGRVEAALASASGGDGDADGTTDPDDDVVEALLALGDASWDLGLVDECRDAYEDALRRTMAPARAGGGDGGGGGGDVPPDHPNVASLLHSLGKVHLRSGAPGEASKWFESSLAMKRRLYGKRAYHPEIGKTLNGLAMMRAGGGDGALEGDGWEGAEGGQVAGTEEDWEMAMRLFEEALRHYTFYKYDRHKHQHGTIGEDDLEGGDYADHLDVAVINENMADLYRRNGEFEMALAKYGEALRVRRIWIPAAGPGGNDPEAVPVFDEKIAELNMDIADCLYGMERIEDAAEAYKQALEAHLTVVRQNAEKAGEEEGEAEGGGTPPTPLTSDHDPLVGQGAPPPAGTALEAVIRHNLGLIHSRRGRFEMARDELWRAHGIKKSLLGETHPEVAKTLNALGALYGTEGEKHSALAYFREALSVFRLHAGELGDDDPDVTDVLRNIALMESPTLGGGNTGRLG